MDRKHFKRAHLAVTGLPHGHGGWMNPKVGLLSPRQAGSQCQRLETKVCPGCEERPASVADGASVGDEVWRKGSQSAPSPVRPRPRTQPIAMTDFAQACAKRAVSANAGFLEECQLRLSRAGWPRARPAPPPSLPAPLAAPAPGHPGGGWLRAAPSWLQAGQHGLP